MSVVIYLLFLVNLINLCVCNGNIDNKIIGESCKLTEPFYSNTFDFNDLKSTLSKSLTDEWSKNRLTFNLCGKSSKKCKGQDVFACLDLHNPKNPEESQKIIGFDQKLIWENGRIHFESTGEPCKDGKNYTLTILMDCSYNTAERQFTLFPSKQNQCDLTIHYKTEKSCLEIPTNVKNSKCFGKNFDLVPLGSQNFQVNARNSKDLFYIGLCQPTLYGHNLQCPKGSTICLVKSDPSLNVTDKYLNVGQMTADPVISMNGVVFLNLTSNTPCKNGKTHESHISFLCDHNPEVKEPEYLGSVDDCAHYFEWNTKFVCSEKNPCQVTNPKTKDVLDMSSLSGHRFSVTNENDTSKIYYFSVCSAPGEPCMGQSTGSCQFDKNKSLSTQLGIVNSDLMILESGAIFLNYTDGSICDVGIHHKHSTRIQFICINGDQKEGPTLIEDKDCEILIHYNTKLACPKNDLCKTRSPDGNSEIDLEALINNQENYVVKVNETNLPNEKAPVQYVLNVCRPLVSKYSLNCQGAACKTVIELDGKHEHELNLGFPDSASSMNSYKEKEKTIVELKYFEGDACPTDKDSDAITSIKFFCDPNTAYGPPILQTIEDCVYNFDFPTNILCEDEIINFQKDTCNLFDTQTEIGVNLKHIGVDGKLEMVDDLNHNSTIDICDSRGFFQIIYKQHRVRAEFQIDTRQKNCNGKYDVDVQLVCSARDHLKIEKDIPVYAGAQSSLIPKPKIIEFHGSDGFNGIYDKKPSKDLVQDKHAVIAIHEYIQKYPGQVTLIGVAPLTNFGLLYKMFPEDIPKISGIFVMGGNYMGVGNTTRCAEFNFYTDPEAAWIVLNESKCPITIYPWEACLDASGSMDMTEFRVNKLGSNKNPFTELLNPVEIKAYKGHHNEWIPCDALAVACFILPHIVKRKEKFHATIELAGNYTKGQLVLDHKRQEKDNVTIVQEIDIDLYKAFIFWVCGHEGSQFPRK